MKWGIGMRSIVHETMLLRALIRRNMCSNDSKEEKFCVGIVGGGPAGFYTAHSLFRDFFELQKENNMQTKIHIDILERTPVGNGLVRSGVAPDHPEVKHVQHRFQEFRSEQNTDKSSLHFYGNIDIGRSSEAALRINEDSVEVSLPQARNCYHAMVFSCGSEGERRLNIPGSTLKGIYSAGAFVRYYNAGLAPLHMENFDVDSTKQFQSGKVAIVGHGNVALDASRILLKGKDALLETDITNRTLSLLGNTRFNEIHIFGRRGPGQASFTNKELREMFEIENCEIYIAKEDLTDLNEASQQEISSSRTHKRMLAMLLKKAILVSKEEMIEAISSTTQNSDSNEKKCFIHFQMSPVEYLPSEKSYSVGEMVLEKTELSGEINKQKARGTGEKIHLKDVGVVLESVGYYPLPIFGVPFVNGSLVHDEGRILNTNGDHMEGLYASGWFKRGANGIIGTNVWDAQETSRSIIDDFSAGRIPLHNRQPMYAGIEEYLKENDCFSQVSTWDHWVNIETIEEDRGRQQNPPKPREKFLTTLEMNKVKNGKE